MVFIFTINKLCNISRKIVRCVMCNLKSREILLWFGLGVSVSLSEVGVLGKLVSDGSCEAILFSYGTLELFFT